LKYDSLVSDARTVLNDLATVAREIENGNQRWYMMRMKPYRTVDDKIDGVVMTFVDVTPLKQAEHHLRELTAELDHRVKNVLARVLAVLERSRAEAASPDEVLASMEARIHSMARTHTLLSRSRWSGVSIRSICTNELEPYSNKDDRSLHGPDVMLNPEAAQMLTMALHELATNAAKYGALSVAGGHVDVTVAILNASGENEQLKLTWKETGGPRITKEPQRHGYGMQIIKDYLSQMYAADINVAFEPNGLKCEMTLPLAEVKMNHELRPQIAVASPPAS